MEFESSRHVIQCWNFVRRLDTMRLIINFLNQRAVTLANNASQSGNCAVQKPYRRDRRNCDAVERSITSNRESTKDINTSRNLKQLRGEVYVIFCLTATLTLQWWAKNESKFSELASKWSRWFSAKSRMNDLRRPKLVCSSSSELKDSWVGWDDLFWFGGIDFDLDLYDIRASRI